MDTSNIELAARLQLLETQLDQALAALTGVGEIAQTLRALTAGPVAAPAIPSFCRPDDLAAARSNTTPVPLFYRPAAQPIIPRFCPASKLVVVPAFDPPPELVS